MNPFRTGIAYLLSWLLLRLLSYSWVVSSRDLTWVITLEWNCVVSKDFKTGSLWPSLSLWYLFYLLDWLCPPLHHLEVDLLSPWETLSLSSTSWNNYLSQFSRRLSKYQIVKDEDADHKWPYAKADLQSFRYIKHPSDADQYWGIPWRKIRPNQKSVRLV